MIPRSPPCAIASWLLIHVFSITSSQSTATCTTSSIMVSANGRILRSISSPFPKADVANTQSSNNHSCDPQGYQREMFTQPEPIPTVPESTMAMTPTCGCTLSFHALAGLPSHPHENSRRRSWSFKFKRQTSVKIKRWNNTTTPRGITSSSIWIN